MGCPGPISIIKSPWKLYWIIGCGFLIYFALGSLIKFIRGYRGVEAIPHNEFWSDFPGYVFDGIEFSINKIKGLTGKKDSEYGNV